MQVFYAALQFPRAFPASATYLPLSKFMATLRPFAALRPKPELAGKICELPYDVMSSDEAREMAAGNPLSFLHVSKPEIDLPPSTNPYAPEVYAKGKENLEKLMAQGALRQEAKPCFYLYRQIMGKHAQVGLVAVASCEEYLSGIIKKHELTRPDKEDDRVRHIETLNSQTGPVFLTYRAQAALDEFIAKKTGEQPDVDFTAPDGVRHTSWVVSDEPWWKFGHDADGRSGRRPGRAWRWGPRDPHARGSDPDGGQDRPRAPASDHAADRPGPGGAGARGRTRADAPHRQEFADRGGAIAGGVSTYSVGGKQLIAVESGNSSKTVWQNIGAAQVIIFGLQD